MNVSGLTLPAGLLLEPVVADRLGGVERLVEVARLEVALGEDRRGPDAGVAVGLELLANRELVGLAGVVAAERSTSRLVPVRFWTWWPISWAIT